MQCIILDSAQGHILAGTFNVVKNKEGKTSTSTYIFHNRL